MLKNYMIVKYLKQCNEKMTIIHDTTFDHALLVNINDADELKPIIVLEFR